MIQSKDLKKGLRVVTLSGMKAIIMSWYYPPQFTIPFLTMKAKRVIPPPYVMLNNQFHINPDLVTWGASSDELNVDLDYYNEQLNHEQHLHRSI